MWVLVLWVSAMQVKAQNNLNQPYSQYGVGTSESLFNMPMAIRRGGAIHPLGGYNFINPFNPASYGSIERESFVFDMGLTLQIANLKDATNSARNTDGNLGHLLLGFPLTKWWKMAAGVMPYSSVDYKTVVRNGGATTTYDGTGGVNEFFIGSAFNVVSSQKQQLQVGFNIGYLAGTIQRAITYTFTDTLSRASRKQKDTEVGNAVLDFGVQYRYALNEQYTLGVGLTYKPKMSLHIDEQAMVYTFTTVGGQEVLLDTIFPAQGATTDIESQLEQPHSLGIGVSIERNGYWEAMVDATFAGSQGLSYEEGGTQRVFGNSAVEEGSYSRCAIGFEKKVRMDAASYWGRIGWSVGAYSDRGVMHLQIDGQSHRVDEWGMGIGASFPMRKGKSLLTISMGYNSLGKEELLQCNTLTFGLAVSSCERWFMKRKYN